jgi:hypothetical protein
MNLAAVLQSCSAAYGDGSKRLVLLLAAGVRAALAHETSAHSAMTPSNSKTGAAHIADLCHSLAALQVWKVKGAALWDRSCGVNGSRPTQALHASSKTLTEFHLRTGLWLHILAHGARLQSAPRGPW